MYRTLARFLLSLTVLLLLTGCLSVETRVTLEDGERGKLTYVYTVSRALLDAEVFDREAENWPIPIARRDFELFDDAVDEADLTAYRREDREEVSIVTATYRFTSLEALGRLLSAEDDIRVEPSGGGEFGYRFQLSPAGVASLTAEQRAFLDSYLQEAAFRFEVTTPEPIASTNHGAPQGRTVTIERSFEELLDRDEPLFLEVSWWAWRSRATRPVPERRPRSQIPELGTTPIPTRKERDSRPH